MRKAALILVPLVLLMVLAPVGKIPGASATRVLASNNLTGLLLDSPNERLYVLDSTAGSVIILSTTSDSEIGRVSVGQNPTGLDISQDGTELYVALPGTSQLSVVDLANLTVRDNIRVTPPPFEVAAGKQGWAYVTTRDAGTPKIIDVSRGRQVGSFNETFAAKAIMRRTADRSLLFIGSGENSAVQIFEYSVLADTVTKIGPTSPRDFSSGLRDMALDSTGSRLYVAALGRAYVQIWRMGDWSFGGALDTGSSPTSVGVATGTTAAFASRYSTSEVDAFNTTSRTELQSYYASHEVVLVRPMPDASKVYTLTKDEASGTRELEVIQIPQWPLGARLKIVGTGVTSLLLNWTRAKPEGSINIYTIGDEAGPRAAVPGNLNTYNATGLRPGTNYLFTVSAENQAGDVTLTSLSASGRTYQDTFPPFWASGSSLAFSDLSASGLVLHWPPAADNVGIGTYRVSRNGVSLADVSNTTYTLQVSGLLPYSTYTFQVQACDTSNNCSAGGLSTTVQTPAPNPSPTPQGFALLYYEAVYIGEPYPGRRVTVQSNFTNRGQTQVQVTGLIIQSDLGRIVQSTGLPLALSPQERRTLTSELVIPSTARIGNHSISITVHWRYFLDKWTNGDSISLYGAIPVRNPAPPSTLATAGSTLSQFVHDILPLSPVIIAGYAVSVGAAITVVLGRELKRRKREVPAT